MLVDAIVLSGGRSSRLATAAKAELLFDGETLLQRTLAAVSDARRIAVVGPPPKQPLPERVIATRESPLFGGPAAGIAAGVSALAEASEQASEPAPEIIIIVACDMPHVAPAIPLLLAAVAEHSDADGVVAVDSSGRQQPLAGAYRTERLVVAITEHEPLDSLPVHRLVKYMTLQQLHLPDEATADVDTWEDARQLGVTAPPAPATARRSP